MQSKSLVISLSVALLASACAVTKPPLASPELERGARRLNYRHDVQLFQVSNGLLVALVPEKNTNLVKVDVRYRIGAAEDPTDKAGLAHLVEHMLFTVRATPSGPSIADRLGQASLSYNAYTNWDETHYTATALTEDLDTLLELEKLRMSTTCAGIDDKVFARERQVVAQELMQRGVASGDAGRVVRRLLFGGKHAYTRSIGGTTKQVMSMTRDDVCSFIDAHYAPSRAIMVVSGHIDTATLRDDIGAMFGPITKTARQTRRPVGPLLSLPPGKTNGIRLDTEQAALVLAFPRPTWGTKAATTDRLLALLLEFALDKAAEHRSAIKGVTTVNLGGYRGGARAFVIWTDKASDLPAALALYKKTWNGSFRTINPRTVKALRRAGQLGVFRTAEPFRSRASLVADYLQYADDKWLMIGELKRLGALTSDSLATLSKSRFDPKDAHIITIRPDERSKATRKRLTLHTETKRYDLESWREPVDAKQADDSLTVPDASSSPKTTEQTFGNGLRVVLVSDLSYPVVDARIVFATGTAHDPADKKGLSHLAATLLDLDYSRTFDRIDVVDVNFIGTLGLSLDTEVGEESTSFHVRGLSPDADAALWQLYRWLQTGVYPKDDLRRLQKRAASRKPDPDAEHSRRAYRALAVGLYGAGHPYVPDAKRADPRRISRADLERYRRTHYRLSGATLIVTGRFDHDDVLRRADRLFGSMRGAGAPPALPSIPAAHPAAGEKHLAVIDDDALQPRILMAFPTAVGVTKHRAARAVLAEMLRLRLDQIRERFGATYGIQVRTSRRRGPGSIVITGNLDPNHGDKALAAMTTAIAELRKGEGLAADFVRARRKVFQKMLASTVDSSAVANELEFVTTHGLDKSYFYKLAGRVARLRPAAIKSLLDTELSAATAVVLIAGKKASVKKLYKAAGIASYQVVK